jgi:hypothetical protein
MTAEFFSTLLRSLAADEHGLTETTPGLPWKVNLKFGCEES